MTVLNNSFITAVFSLRPPLNTGSCMRLSKAPLVKILVAVIINLWCLFALTASVFSETNSPGFYFVQLTDTHCGSARSLAALKKAVSLINALPFPIAFVAVTGDMTSENIHNPEVMTNAMAQFNQLKAPVHYLPGNHDILARRFEGSLNHYRSYFGAPYHTMETNQVQFIFFYDEPLRNANLVMPGYEPLEWLREQLTRADAKPAIIFMHSALVQDFYNNRFHASWPDEPGQRFSELINRNKVAAVITGHFHRDEFHWVGQVPLYVSAPIDDMWKRQPSFRVYEYHEGKVSYFTQYLE